MLANGEKWTTHAGVEELYDLSADPGETADKAGGIDNAAYRDALGAALQTEVPMVWRLRASPQRLEPGQQALLEVRHPDGIAAAWLGGDPLDEAGMSLEHDEGVVRVEFARGGNGALEIFVQGRGTAPEGLQLRFVDPAGVEHAGTVGAVAAAADGALYTLKAGERTVELTRSAAPVPFGDALRAVDDESMGALKALGYVE